MYWLDDVSFIAHPNTGSRSLKKMILGANGGKVINDQHGVCWETVKNSRAVVCVIRNPYDMMASWYWRMISKPDFNTWLSYTLNQSNGNHEDPDKVGGGLFFGLKRSTHIIRFENIEEGYNDLFEDLQFPVKLKLGHEGKARFRNGQNYQVLYNQDAINIVAKKYGSLMKSLKYGF